LNPLTLEVIWRWTVRIQWCWNASKITSVTLIERFPSGQRDHWFWRGETEFLVDGQPGKPSYATVTGSLVSVISQARFERCPSSSYNAEVTTQKVGVKVARTQGCVEERMPRIWMNVSRGGTFTYQTIS
jgi:hypothetical protein